MADGRTEFKIRGGGVAVGVSCCAYFGSNSCLHSLLADIQITSTMVLQIVEVCEIFLCGCQHLKSSNEVLFAVGLVVRCVCYVCSFVWPCKCTCIYMYLFALCVCVCVCVCLCVCGHATCVGIGVCVYVGVGVCVCGCGHATCVGVGVCGCMCV